jgi:phosphopantothenoylcysteine decarboxylase/phosphopantothenate--cysteine ligase
MTVTETTPEVLDGREVLVGVSGGIASYKTAILVSRLVQDGAGVTVVMTEAATHFVGAATFEALTGRGVVTGLFGDPRFPLGAHIQLSERADLLIVAPATANFLAKAAGGLADDALSTLYLAFSGPSLFSPAMNATMWENPAVQRNCQHLADDGVMFVGPGEGWLSCRTQGIGRMAEASEIHAAILQQLVPVAPPVPND